MLRALWVTDAVWALVLVLMAIWNFRLGRSQKRLTEELSVVRKGVMGCVPVLIHIGLMALVDELNKQHHTGRLDVETLHQILPYRLGEASSEFQIWRCKLMRSNHVGSETFDSVIVEVYVSEGADEGVITVLSVPLNANRHYTFGELTCVMSYLTHIPSQLAARERLAS